MEGSGSGPEPLTNGSGSGTLPTYYLGPEYFNSEAILRDTEVNKSRPLIFITVKMNTYGVQDHSPRYACPRILKKTTLSLFWRFAYLVADLAEIAKQLMVVGLAVGQAFPLIVPVYQDNQVFFLSTNFVFIFRQLFRATAYTTIGTLHNPPSATSEIV